MIHGCRDTIDFVMATIFRYCHNAHFDIFRLHYNEVSNLVIANVYNSGNTTSADVMMSFSACIRRDLSHNKSYYLSRKILKVDNLFGWSLHMCQQFIEQFQTNL